MPTRSAACVCLLLAFALGACTPSAPPPPNGAKRADADRRASLNAEGALLRLLVLIRDRPELRDVDREVLQQSFGVPFTSGEDSEDAEEGLRYTGALAGGWTVSIVLTRPATEEATLELSFAPE